MNCPHCGKDPETKPVEFHWLHVKGVNQSIELVTTIPTYKRVGRQYVKHLRDGVPLIYVAPRQKEEMP